MKNKSALVIIAAIIAADFVLPRLLINMASKSALPLEWRLCVACFALVVVLLSVL